MVEAMRQIAVRHELRPVFFFLRPTGGSMARAAAKPLGNLSFDAVSATDYGRFERFSRS
jgi:hypothetical protein